ncbi:MAG: dipeptide/oligopeptide/nickel ABC transporter ATP-binding protein [Myxococcota bacterium]
MTAWALHDVHKTYRASWFGGPVHAALRGASLQVGERERLALIGPSGSGKTTLVRCGLGLVRPDSGRISVLGRDVGALDRSGWHALRAQVQVMFQDPRAMLHPDLPIGVLLRESARLHRRAEDPDRVAASALSAVGIAHRIDALPHELSGGERRRAGIARVALTRPQLLVADEPTSGLDAALKGQMISVLLEAVGPGCAVVLVSHDLAAVAPYCDRVAVVDQGRVVESFPAAALFEGYEASEPVTHALLRAAGAPFRRPPQRSEGR